METLITIFTPTYNRAHTLSRLYDSLINQTYKNFEWIIVDDGSTDNTEMLVGEFIKNDLINIRYFKQDNGGKHRAINVGVENAHGKLFFIVDSDDWLYNKALDKINLHYNRIKSNSEYCGVSGLRSFPDGKTIGGEKSFEELNSNALEIRYKYKIKGDLAEVYKVSVLKEFKFPEIENEYFCAESLIWNRIAQKYKIKYFSENIYYCDYLEGGLTANSIRNRRKSPNYARILYKELANTSHLPLKFRLKAYINYWRFGLLTDLSIKHHLKFLSNNLLSIFSLPLGWLLMQKDNYLSKKNK